MPFERGFRAPVTHLSRVVLALVLAGFAGPARTRGQEVVLAEQKPDPHGFPRPFRDARDVPLKTSFYFELKLNPPTRGDSVDPSTVSVELEPDGGPAIPILSSDQRFAAGYFGKFEPRQDMAGASSLAVNIDSHQALRPLTSYTVRVGARSKQGASLPTGKGSWRFTTEAAPGTHPVVFGLDLSSAPVRWQGAFFSGFCNIAFCSDTKTFGKTYELMAESRSQHPRAWSLQRDFWLTGTEYQPQFFPNPLPNLVRERETRRIRSIELKGEEALLRVEDFFGHRQYGIASDRPLAEDYHRGDEVLVSDGVQSARARVIATDDQARTVRVTAFETPEGGWKIEYAGPLPTRENPDAPGLFAPGGCTLQKALPHGTPCYYWGRLDKEWDLAHRRFGRRLFVNFADAAGDTSRDGRSWTTVKDYAEWHAVVGTITGHIIDRYGKDSLSFVWSVFNEPDLGGLFWRATWDELQTFYDYTVDAVLRAFEDRGFDSSKVFIGGLELGGIFGTNLKLREFLAHCSPRAQAKGALPRNAAVADRRLDGKRSRRVETLCGSHDGKGSPCDFISIHAYNRSALMADKLIRAKQVALEIDPEFYRTLWVNSHESCPEWNPPPDIAAADSYLGDGYFPTWCADVAARQLRKAAADPRFGFGETILTTWPPNQNFRSLNAFTRKIDCDDDGDGRPDRVVTVPMPIFHALGLLSDLGPNYWLLPEQRFGGHRVSGFASRDDGAVRILLYAHHEEDTQSRSESDFEVTLALEKLGLDARRVNVREYRFDADHNSYFRLGRTLRDRVGPASTEASGTRLKPLLEGLTSDDPSVQRKAIAALAALGPAARGAGAELFRSIPRFRDEEVKSAAIDALKSILGGLSYPRAEVEEIEERSRLRTTGTLTLPVSRDSLRVSARVAGNGLNFLVIEPVR